MKQDSPSAQERQTGHVPPQDGDIAMDGQDMPTITPTRNPGDYIRNLLDRLTDNDIGDFESIDAALLSVVNDEDVAWMAERAGQSVEVCCG